MIANQWIRKIGLYVTSATEALDLSEFRVVFKTSNADFESPNSAFIRIYNLDASQIQKIKKEYTQVTLNAGYQTGGDASGSYGVIFQGSIIQYRFGRESATDTYFDILASDGDLGYNDAFFQKNYVAGTPLVQTMQDAANTIAQANLAQPNAKNPDVTINFSNIDASHNPSIRGQVMMGMAKAHLRMTSRTFQHMWSVQNGVVQIVPMKGNQNGTQKKPFLINALTGMIGIPEQTVSGIEVKCLLNPQIQIGSFVKLNNSDITQLEQQNSSMALVYNSYAQIQANTPLATQADGEYMVFVAEHEGDTRGPEWYTKLVCLAVEVDQQVIANN